MHFLVETRSRLVWDKLLPVCIPGDYLNAWQPDKSGYWSHRPGPNLNIDAEPDNREWPTPGRSILTQMPNYPSIPPPMAVLETTSLLTATNLAGTITYQITVIYSSTIQIELMSGNPQFAGWSYNVAQNTYDQSEQNTQICQGPVCICNTTKQYKRLCKTLILQLQMSERTCTSSYIHGLSRTCSDYIFHKTNTHAQHSRKQ